MKYVLTFKKKFSRSFCCLIGFICAISCFSMKVFGTIKCDDIFIKSQSSDKQNNSKLVDNNLIPPWFGNNKSLKALSDWTFLPKYYFNTSDGHLRYGTRQIVDSEELEYLKNHPINMDPTLWISYCKYIHIPGLSYKTPKQLIDKQILDHFKSISFLLDKPSFYLVGDQAYDFEDLQRKLSEDRENKIKTSEAHKLFEKLIKTGAIYYVDIDTGEVKEVSATKIPLLFQMNTMRISTEVRKNGEDLIGFVFDAYSLYRFTGVMIESVLLGSKSIRQLVKKMADDFANGKLSVDFNYPFAEVMEWAKTQKRINKDITENRHGNIGTINYLWGLYNEGKARGAVLKDANGTLLAGTILFYSSGVVIKDTVLKRESDNLDYSTMLSLITYIRFHLQTSAGKMSWTETVTGYTNERLKAKFIATELFLKLRDEDIKARGNEIKRFNFNTPMSAEEIRTVFAPFFVDQEQQVKPTITVKNNSYSKKSNNRPIDTIGSDDIKFKITDTGESKIQIIQISGKNLDYIQQFINFANYRFAIDNVAAYVSIKSLDMVENGIMFKIVGNASNLFPKDYLKKIAEEFWETLK